MIKQICFIIFLSFASSGFVTFVDDLVLYHNPKYLNNVKGWIERNDVDNTKYLLNLELFFIHKWNEVYMTMKIYEKPSEHEDYTKRLFDYTIDLCRALKKTRKSDVFFLFFFKVMKRYGKPPDGCPIGNGSYYYHNLTLNSFKVPLFSSLMFGNQMHYTQLTFHLFTKMKRKPLALFNVTFFCGYKNM